MFDNTDEVVNNEFLALEDSLTNKINDKLISLGAKKENLKEITTFFPNIDNELQGTNSSGSLGGLDVRRRIPIKLISKQGNKAKASPRTPRTINRMPAKAPAGDEGNVFNRSKSLSFISDSTK